MPPPVPGLKLILTPEQAIKIRMFVKIALADNYMKTIIDIQATKVYWH